MSLSFEECLKRGRTWLAETNDDLCRRYGLRPNHLRLERTKGKPELIVRRDPEYGGRPVGYRFSLIRHPAQTRLEQVWLIDFSGRMKLCLERPLGFGRLRHQGRLITRKELWG